MAKRKLKFTALDFVLVLIILCFSTYFFFGSYVVETLNGENSIEDVVITVAVKGIDRQNFKYFENGSVINRDFGDELLKIGSISGIRSCPAVKLHENDSGFVYAPDFTAVDAWIEISARCVSDRNGFYSIDGEYFAPAGVFEADNGHIKFECEVVSVKTR